MRVCDFCQSVINSTSQEYKCDGIAEPCLVKCGNCRKIYSQSEAASNKTSGMKYQCEKCGKVFKTTYGLTYHGIHSHGIKPKSKLMPVHCEICNKIIRDKYSLRTHLKIVHGEKNVKCILEGCEKMFSTESCMMDHYKRHLGQRVFKCEHCDHSFQNKSNLRNHIQGVHLDVKPYECSLCEQKFVCQSYLTQHIKRKHDGSKTKFCCQEENCNKQFVSKIDFINHHNIHSGFKPYLCSVCGYSAAYKGNLRSHLKIHEKRTKYRCTQCNRDFFNLASQQRCIKRHLENTSTSNGLIGIVPTPHYALNFNSLEPSNYPKCPITREESIVSFGESLFCNLQFKGGSDAGRLLDKQEPFIFSSVEDDSFVTPCGNMQEEGPNLKSTDPFNDLNLFMTTDYNDSLLLNDDPSLEESSKENCTKENINDPATLDCVKCSQLTDIALLIEHLDTDHQCEV